MSVPVGAAGRTTTALQADTSGMSPSFEGKLIAVIDDDPRVLDSMGGLLRSWGCTVVKATSPQEAHAQLEEQGRPPDLIIADYNLADGLTGIDAIKTVRARFGGKIPAFLISADATPERLGDLRSAGFQLLRKPASPVMLRALMLSKIASDVQTLPGSQVAEPNF